MAYCLPIYTFCTDVNFGVNCYVYTDPKRTTPVSTGWLSNGGNVYSVNSAGMITAVTACSSCPVVDTYLYISCSGCDLYYVYADGNCGTYSTLVAYNSSDCGCGGYYCSCWGWDCDPYPNPCYYYGCSECAAP